jgi:flagellar assembly protein FliH
MSSRARRVVEPSGVIAFPWRGELLEDAVPVPAPPRASEPVKRVTEVESQSAAAERDAHLAALEREAFAKGYEQGERSGAAVAAQRGEAMLQRLTQTLEELTTLRTDMIRSTERQLVQLSLAVARRIVHREVSLDADLLIAMARVALDRLGETAQVTVRLHPEEYDATGAGRTPVLGSHVTVVADASVGRGGCRVESDFGTMDAGIDAQMQELARALLGEAEMAAGRG